MDHSCRSLDHPCRSMDHPCCFRSDVVFTTTSDPSDNHCLVLGCNSQNNNILLGMSNSIRSWFLAAETLWMWVRWRKPDGNVASWLLERFTCCNLKHRTDEGGDNNRKSSIFCPLKWSLVFMAAGTRENTEADSEWSPGLYLEQMTSWEV